MGMKNGGERGEQEEGRESRGHREYLLPQESLSGTVIWGTGEDLNFSSSLPLRPSLFKLHRVAAARKGRNRATTEVPSLPFFVTLSHRPPQAS